MVEKIMAWVAAVPYGNALYWIPFAMCAVTYAVRTFNGVNRDLYNRENDGYYTPSVTVGLIIWYIFITITPAVNLLSAVFDCLPGIGKFLSRTFDIPLVRDTAEAAKKRTAIRQAREATRS